MYILCFHFQLISRMVFISLWFLPQPNCHLVVCCLVPLSLGTDVVSTTVDIQLYSFVVR